MIPRTLLSMGKRTDFNTGKVVELGHGEAGVLTEKGTLLNQEYRVPLSGRKCQLLPNHVRFCQSMEHKHQSAALLKISLKLPHANANQLKPLSQCLWRSFV